MRGSAKAFVKCVATATRGRELIVISLLMSTAASSTIDVSPLKMVSLSFVQKTYTDVCTYSPNRNLLYISWPLASAIAIGILVLDAARWSRSRDSPIECTVSLI